VTQAQIDHEVAGATGESLDLIHKLGFSLMADDRTDPHPEALYLVINCPHCRRPTLYPGQLADGSYPMAECPGCDALFAFDVLDVYVAASSRG
jgi:hypothetical protein